MMKPDRMSNPATALEQAARDIRAHLGELYRCPDSRRIILCPGQLIGLIHILCARRCESLLLTDEEYYTPHHFPGMKVSTCKPEEVVRVVQHKRPGAVLMSVVSWKGRPLPVRQQFQRLREHPDRPLLICDYAHAGAVGFPRFGGFGADIICGDVHKWVLPSAHMSQIGFVWATNRRLRESLSGTFRGYYLATDQSIARAARWISPQDLLSTAQWLRDAKPTRRTMLAAYRRNLARAREIAEFLCLSKPEKSCILWLPIQEVNRQARELRNIGSRGDVQFWRAAAGWRLITFPSKQHSLRDTTP
jgi:hypothetical protein